MLPNNKRRNRESGNAFFIVMIGVVLFAALMYTFSKGARQGQTNLTTKKIGMNITDILAYAPRVQRGVERVYSNGFSETDISFQNTYASGYTNASCVDSRCMVFNASGGSITWEKFRELPVKDDVCCGYETDAFHITSEAKVIGVGDDANPELLMMIPIEGAANCTRINEELGNSSTIFTLAGTHTFTRHTGAFTYASGQDISGDLQGVTSGCFSQTGKQTDLHWFYQVLLER